MLKENKYLIYGGSLFAGVAITAGVIDIDQGICLDRRVMCGPLPMHMADVPGEDAPHPLQTINSFAAATSSTSSVMTGLSLANGWRISSS